MGEALERMKAEHIERRARMRAAAYVPPAAIVPSIAAEPSPAFFFRGRPYTEVTWQGATPAPDPHDTVDDELWLKQQVRSISVRAIIQTVAAEFGVTLVDMASARRTRVVVMPRQIAMYLARKLTTRSLPEIGRCFGGRDHTTVFHAYHKIDGLLKTDTDLVARVAMLEARVSEQ